jgi:type IV pilus assembly protein PilQ
MSIMTIEIIRNRIIKVMPRATTLVLLMVFISLCQIWYPARASGNSSPTVPGARDAFDPIAYGGGGNIHLDVRGVDLRDVLSALAIKMGANIVIVNNEPIDVTFKADAVTPKKAFEMIIQSNGLAYLQNGDLLVVGEAGTLDKDFFSQMLLTRFDTSYVPAEKIVAMIKELGMDESLKVLSIDTNPNVFWAQGTVQSLRKVKELVYAVDTEDNKENVLSLTPLEYKTITLTQIPPSRAVELLEEAGVEIKRHLYLDNRLLVFDRELFPRWEDVQTFVSQLDFQSANKHKAFVYQLKNIVAAGAAKWIETFGFYDVKTVSHNNDRLGKELLVICPPELENQVRSALGSLDGTRTKTKMPVLTVKGSSESGSNPHQCLVTTRELLSELSGVPVGSFTISGNLSGDGKNPMYALWVEETPDNIMLIKDLVKELGLGGSGGEEE